MRLHDLVFRRGHLGERALVDTVLTGERPGHLDRCEACAERADAVGRWLDQVAQASLAATDAVFPAEVLARQRAQILRKLELLDEPARVLEFPSHVRAALAGEGPRGVAPRWVGIAAAAGLVLGLLGGQLTARLGEREPGPLQSVGAQGPGLSALPESTSLFELNLDSVPQALLAFDELTPSEVDPQLAANGGG